MGIKHNYQSGTANDGAKEVSSTRWNENHVVDSQIHIHEDITPATPAASFFGLFGDTRGGGVQPAFVDPDGAYSILQPSLAKRRVGRHLAFGNGTSVVADGVGLNTTGTATAANCASTNVHTAMRRLEYAVTTAATNAVAGIRESPGSQLLLGTTGRIYGGFRYISRFGRSRGVAANATLRAFNGLSSLTSAPTDVEPSTTVTDAIGVGCDAGDTNWQIMHRTGSGTTTKVNTGFAKAVSDTAEMYELMLYSPPGVTTRVEYVFTRLSDGATFSGTITTALPANTTLLSFRNYYSVGGTSSVIGYAHSQILIETDYF